MHKYGLQNTFHALPGKGNELAAILLEASLLVSSAEGCQLYVVGIDATNNDIVHVTEAWDTRENHDDSLKAVGVRELIGKALPLLSKTPEKGTTTQILGGKGIL